MDAHPLQTASYTVTEFAEDNQERWDEYVLGSPGGGHALQGYQWGSSSENRAGGR